MDEDQVSVRISLWSSQRPNVYLPSITISQPGSVPGGHQPCPPGRSLCPAPGWGLPARMGPQASPLLQAGAPLPCLKPTAPASPPDYTARRPPAALCLSPPPSGMPSLWGAPWVSGPRGSQAVSHPAGPGVPELRQEQSCLRASRVVERVPSWFEGSVSMRRPCRLMVRLVRLVPAHRQDSPGRGRRVFWTLPCTSPGISPGFGAPSRLHSPEPRSPGQHNGSGWLVTGWHHVACLPSRPGSEILPREPRGSLPRSPWHLCRTCVCLSLGPCSWRRVSARVWRIIRNVEAFANLGIRTACHMSVFTGLCLSCALATHRSFVFLSL